MEDSRETRSDLSPGSVASVQKFAGALFLLGLLLLMGMTPFVEALRYGQLIEATLLSVAFVAAVPAARGSRKTLFVAGLLAFPAVAGKWLHYFRPEWFPAPVFLVASVVFATYIVVLQLRFILRAPEVDSEVLCAGVSTFLMLGVLWSFVFLFVDRVNEASFVFRGGAEADRPLTGVEAFYFSFGRLAGPVTDDFAPGTSETRMLAVLESITGLFYMAILISRIVALHTARQVPM